MEDEGREQGWQMQRRQRTGMTMAVVDDDNGGQG